MLSIKNKPRFAASAIELAADYKAKKHSAQESYSLFVKDRNANPELNAKEFVRIYKSVLPKLFQEKELKGTFIATHMLVETFDSQPKKIQLIQEHEKHITFIMCYENGEYCTASTPRKYIKNLYKI